MTDPKRPDPKKSGEQGNATTDGGASTERGGRDAGMPGPANISDLDTGDQPDNQPETDEMTGATTGGQESADNRGRRSSRDDTTD